MPSVRYRSTVSGLRAVGEVHREREDEHTHGEQDPPSMGVQARDPVAPPLDADDAVEHERILAGELLGHLAGTSGVLAYAGNEVRKLPRTSRPASPACSS
jgi:hypothetical protein